MRTLVAACTEFLAHAQARATAWLDLGKGPVAVNGTAGAAESWLGGLEPATDGDSVLTRDVGISLLCCVK